VGRFMILSKFYSLINIIVHGMLSAHATSLNFGMISFCKVVTTV